MATKAVVLRAVLEDVIVNRVGAATESDVLSEKWRYHGDRHDLAAGTAIRENEGSTRLFAVEFQPSLAVPMFGATLQSYDVPVSVVVGYPPSVAGHIAAACDWAAIRANFLNGSWTATGLGGYQATDEPVLEINDEWMWLVINVTARIEADL